MIDMSFAVLSIVPENAMSVPVESTGVPFHVNGQLQLCVIEMVLLDSPAWNVSESGVTVIAFSSTVVVLSQPTTNASAAQSKIVFILVSKAAKGC